MALFQARGENSKSILSVSPQRVSFVLEYSLASYLLFVTFSLLIHHVSLQCKDWDLNIWNCIWESPDWKFLFFLRLQLWLPHIFHWPLMLLTATLFELTFIKIMFILAYPLMKVCRPLYAKVLCEVSVEFLGFFLILYSSLFLHKLINFCISITSVFMSPSSLQ